MSSSADPPAATGVGLGYGIAIAVSLLVLISTIMLASYACVRVKSHNLRATSDDGDPDAADPVPRRAAETVVAVGMDGAAIETYYPKLVLGESKRLPKHNEGGHCSICLAEYEARDVIRCVPGCSHCFHANCVDAWLRVSATCPLCRSSPAPTPLATPAPLAINPR
ncbi:hypothetical protein BT93_J0832 [Corymbia citriodora subsp. variegata]|nr:hypothetical protein BT93_J0832 [Corymbia citriodora subsp. variegata]